MSKSKQQKQKRVSNDQKSRPNLCTSPWDELKGTWLIELDFVKREIFLKDLMRITLYKGDN